MNKAELVAVIAEQVKITKTKSAEVLDTIVNTIKAELANGNEVNISNFGKFSVVRRPARNGRNPQTGEAIQIAEKMVPKFKAGKFLKDSVNG